MGQMFSRAFQWFQPTLRLQAFGCLRLFPRPTAVPSRARKRSHTMLKLEEVRTLCLPLNTRQKHARVGTAIQVFVVLYRVVLIDGAFAGKQHLREPWRLDIQHARSQSVGGLNTSRSASVSIPHPGSFAFLPSSNSSCD